MNIKRGMHGNYAGIFIGEFVKNMNLKEYEHEPDGFNKKTFYKIL